MRMMCLLGRSCSESCWAFCFRWHADVVKVKSGRVGCEKDGLGTEDMEKRRFVNVVAGSKDMVRRALNIARNQPCLRVQWYRYLAHDFTGLAISSLDDAVCASTEKCASIRAVTQTPAASLVPPCLPCSVDVSKSVG